MIQKKIDLINKLIDDTYYKKRHHYFDFIVEIIEFLDDLHNIRKEFVSNNICLYNEFVKLFVGQCYFNYLKGDKFSYLPFSIKSQSERYKEISKQNDDLPDLFTQEKSIYNMPLIKETSVCVGKKDYFKSCGESNLLNFIKYILTDTSEKKITHSKIEYFNSLYPSNKLKEIFDGKIINQSNDIMQRNLLQNRLNRFAEIISNDENKSIYRGDISEIYPTLDNSMYILQKILGCTEIKNGETFLKEISDKFNKKYETTEDGRIKYNDKKITYNDKVQFLFDESHADTSIEFLKFSNLNIINLVHNKLLINYEDEQYFFGNYINIINYLFINNNPNFDMIRLVNNNIYIHIDINYYLEFIDCFQIYLNLKFNENIPTNLFTNVKIINFGDSYNQPINDNAFINCEKVVFKKSFNANIPASSFIKVKEIIFGQMYNQPINEDAFPSCKTVIFGQSFNTIIPASSFKSIENINYIGSKKITILDNKKIISISEKDLNDNPNLKIILDSELMKRLEKENEIKTGGSINYKQKYLKYKQKYLTLKKSFL